MNKRITILLTAVLIVLPWGGCQKPQNRGESPSVNKQPPPELIVDGLLPGRVLEKDRGRTFPLAERMKHLRVPGFSYALIEDDQIRAGGYGITDIGTGTALTAATRFQAASMSKAVAAFGALVMVEKGVLDLDRPVNDYLGEWKIPDDEQGQAGKITLRHLLSHTAALTVHGFPGYSPDADLPTPRQILDGQKPANTGPIRIEGRVGEIWRYSGGGYTVAQEVMEQVSKKPFEQLMRELVLDPLGMKHSTFQQPAPAEFTRKAAFALNQRGERTGDPWHVYPEQAAAGLWTTAGDYARFILGIMAAVRGEEGALIPADLAREMIRPVKNGYGLGLAVGGDGDSLEISHGGSNYGYKCTFFYRPARRFGLVLMAGGDNGATLFSEILRGVKTRMGWDPPPQESLSPLPLPEGYEAFTGKWRIESIDLTVHIFHKDGALWAEPPEAIPWRLYHIGDNRYRMLEEDAVLTMLPAGKDQTEAIVTASLGGRTFPMTRVE